jgi:diacylglycerol kinase family enzyme
LNPSAANAPWVKAMTEGQTTMAPWSWVAREHPRHTETLIDWALKEKVERIVVWGGDGSFHRVAGGLWRRKALDKIEVALVPVGTCNDLARRLQLSKYFWRRWEAPAPEGRLASLRLGRLGWKAEDGSEGEDIFVNNAGFGRPRSSFERKEPAWKVLRSFAPLRVSARWKEGELQSLCYMMLAVKGPYFSGGLHFEKDVSPEEGPIRFYFVPARSKARLAAKLLAGRLGTPLMDSKTTRFTAERAVVQSETPVWPQCDGEPPPESGVRWMEFEVLPEPMKMWVP